MEFSTDPGKSWYELFQNHVEDLVSHEAVANAADLYPYNTLTTKEAFYYRQIFEELFPSQSHLIPYY